MNTVKAVLALFQSAHLTRLKLVLLACFSFLVSFQFLIGLRSFEDYFIVFIFILFLNDLYFKLKEPTHFSHELSQQDQQKNRIGMSFVFLMLFLMPFLFDLARVSNSARLVVFKIGFVLWSQVFLLDSFLHYKETHSKQWLVFTNTAILLVMVGAFIGL